LHHPWQSVAEQSLPLSGHLKLPYLFGSGVGGLPSAHLLEAEVEVEVEVEAEEGVVEAEGVEEPPHWLDSSDSREIPENLDWLDS
jgi:hypothetical protein